MESLTERTKSLVLQSIDVMIVFIVLNVIINIPNSLSVLPQNNANSDMLRTFTVQVTSIFFDFFIVPFIHAGMYGIVFRKINSRKISLNHFFSLAKETYWIFFKISIVMGLILGLCFIGFPGILSLFNPSTDFIMTISSYINPILTFLVMLFFVFAYPLAIVGFFSSQNLNPIRSSLSEVINNFGKIKLIILLMVLYFPIGFLLDFVIPNYYTYYKNILSAILTTPIEFIIIIYSYLLITEHFNKDLQFDFDKAT
jgi:hypothetical protein